MSVDGQESRCQLCVFTLEPLSESADIRNSKELLVQHMILMVVCAKMARVELNATKLQVLSNCKHKNLMIKHDYNLGESTYIFGCVSRGL